MAVKNNAFLVKLEPEIEVTDSSGEKLLKLLKSAGFRKDSWALNPTSTIHIDLKRGEEEILKSMEKDTRYSVRLALRKGVRIAETNDFEQFKKLYLAMAARKKFWPAKKELRILWEVFHKNGKAAILTALYNNETLASTLLLFNKDQGHYAHAASQDKNREVMATYLLLWESIKFLKKKGCSVFDLEGIKDKRFKATKKWGGFTLFKRGFGGREIVYLGSFTKYHKLWAKVLFFFARF